jgi:hypothetical protein
LSSGIDASITILLTDKTASEDFMKIAPSTFTANPKVQEAQRELAKGGELILEAGGSHDQEAISRALSSPDFQKQVLAGAALGGLGGIAVGVVIDGVTQTHPAVGTFAKYFLGVLGAVVGGVAAPDALPAAQTATGKTPIEVAYDAKAGHFIARLKPQPAK